VDRFTQPWLTFAVPCTLVVSGLAWMNSPLLLIRTAHFVTIQVPTRRGLGYVTSLVEAMAGGDVESELGDDLRARWAEEVEPLLDKVCLFEGATELLGEVRRRGLPVVLASSGKADHLDKYLDLLDARTVVQAWTTADDVRTSKPAPDLLQAAVDKVEGSVPVMVGDFTWDFVASRKAGHLGYAVRTGGFSEQELRDAGTEAVFDSLTDLRHALDNTALRGLRS
jgi:HAD superfamily hydrolase (TIGR01549 family)